MNGEEKSAAAEILEYERNVATALRRLARRTNYEPATSDTPLYAVIEAEEGQLDEWGIRNETVRTLFAYLLGDGPHPAQVLRRLYAIGSHMMIEPFCLLNLREKALMLGDSHGAQHWRMKRICTDPLLRKGARSVKAPGQKGARASAAAAVAQRGNHNRRGGRASRDEARGFSSNGHGAVAPKTRPKTKRP